LRSTIGNECAQRTVSFRDARLDLRRRTRGTSNANTAPILGEYLVCSGRHDCWCT
jgi:hypothetical protein